MLPSPEAASFSPLSCSLVARFSHFPQALSLLFSSLWSSYGTFLPFVSWYWNVVEDGRAHVSLRVNIPSKEEEENNRRRRAQAAVARKRSKETFSNQRSKWNGSAGWREGEEEECAVRSVEKCGEEKVEAVENWSRAARSYSSELSRNFASISRIVGWRWTEKSPFPVRENFWCMSAGVVVGNRNLPRKWEREREWAREGQRRGAVCCSKREQNLFAPPLIAARRPEQKKIGRARSKFCFYWVFGFFP